VLEVPVKRYPEFCYEVSYLRKLEWWGGQPGVCKNLDMFSRFGTMPECFRETGGETELLYFYRKPIVLMESLPQRRVIYIRAFPFGRTVSCVSFFFNITFTVHCDYRVYKQIKTLLQLPRCLRWLLRLDVIRRNDERLIGHRTLWPLQIEAISCDWLWRSTQCTKVKFQRQIIIEQIVITRDIAYKICRMMPRILPCRRDRMRTLISSYVFLPNSGYNQLRQLRPVIRSLLQRFRRLFHSAWTIATHCGTSGHGRSKGWPRDTHTASVTLAAVAAAYRVQGHRLCPPVSDCTRHLCTLPTTVAWCQS